MADLSQIAEPNWEEARRCAAPFGQTYAVSAHSIAGSGRRGVESLRTAGFRPKRSSEPSIQFRERQLTGNYREQAELAQDLTATRPTHTGSKPAIWGHPNWNRIRPQTPHETHVVVPPKTSRLSNHRLAVIGVLNMSRSPA
jgi:hypothetical protein